jgi:hypothetical protein
MRWLPAIGAMALVAAAIGCGDGAGGGGQCSSVIRWNGRVYGATEAVDIKPLPRAGRSYQMSQGGCSDGGGDPEPMTKLKLFERRGIPASILLTEGAGDRPNLLFVSDDSMPALRDHPLHGVFFDSASEPDLVSGSCRPRVMRGTVRGVPTWGEQSVAFDEGPEEGRFAIDANTQLKTRVVDGVPRLRAGDRVEVDAVVCPQSEIPVARVIQPA